MMKEVQVGWRGRDQLRITVSLGPQGELQSSEVQGVGCPAFLQALGELRQALASGVGRAASEVFDRLAIPVGADHVSMLIREATLKVQERWVFPYGEEELCHCRKIATEKVDKAIVGGCHSRDAVSAATSAGTSCGTCRKDIEKIIAWRLGRD